MPRLLPGSDDEFVVRVAWEGTEEAESTWEPVSRVFDGATAMLRKKLKALLLKMDHKRGLVQRYGLRFLSYCGLGGIPNFELLIFGLIEMLNFEYLLWLGISAPGADSTSLNENFCFSDQHHKLQGAFCFLGRGKRGTNRN